MTANVMNTNNMNDVIMRNLLKYNSKLKNEIIYRLSRLHFYPTQPLQLKK